MNSDSSIERIFNVTVVLIATFAFSMVVCTGQEITRADLIQGPTSCGHVISLINRHGVNQSFDITAEMGDLQIVSVHQINHGEPTCGPKIAVVIANHSNRCVENFSVTAVATLGRLHHHSPNQTVCVGKIQPSESLQVEITLPIECLAMGNRAGQVIGFQRLVIAIDCFDELAETNEANNIQALAVAAIPFLETVVQSTPTIPTQVFSGGQAGAAESSTNDSVGADSASIPTNPASLPVNEDPLQSAINQLGKASTANGS